MPRKHCRSILRTRGSRVLTAETHMVKLFDYTQKRESGWEDWQFRTVSQAHADALVAANKAVRVTRMKAGVVCLVGYRALTPTRPLRGTPCTLTRSTMDVVGKRAMGGDALTPWELRAAEKFDVWALVGDTKTPLATVRPRISEAEKRRAEFLLGAHRLPIGATFDAGMQAT